MLACTVGSLETARQNVPVVSQTFPARFSETRADPWYAPPTSKRKLKRLPFRGISKCFYGSAVNFNFSSSWASGGCPGSGG